MKSYLIIFLLALATSTLTAQSAKEICSEPNYIIQGVFSNTSNTAPALQDADVSMVKVGDKGELSKYFEENIFGFQSTGWMEIGSVQVTAVKNGIITFKVLEKKSVVKINGEEKSHFVAGKIIKFKQYNYKEPVEVKNYWENGNLKEAGNSICGKNVGPWRYYFANGNMDEEVNYNNEGELNGSIRIFYENGNLRRDGNAKNGIEDGLWKYYDENGTLTHQSTYAKGLITGPYLSFYPNGNKKTEGELVNDKKEGIWKHYEESGHLEFQSYYTHDERTGLYTHYHQNGNIKREGQLINNIENGEWKYFYEDGKPKSIVNVTNNVLHGPYKMWYNNGQLQEEGSYNSNGEIEGLISTYYEDGKPKAKGTYAQDKKTGKWQEWNEKGKKKVVKY